MISKRVKKKRSGVLALITFLTYFILCMVSLGYMISGLFMFTVGYHNIDIAANFMNAEDHMNLFVAKEGLNHTFEVYETSLTSEDPVPLVTVYKLGLIQIKRGIFIVMVSAVLFGFSFNTLIFRR